MTRYIYATAPDGTVVRRRTDRKYAFAVLVNTPEGADSALGNNRAEGWTAPSWSGRRDLAEKQAEKFRSHGYRVVVAAARETKEEAS